jgi:ElaB/YqjD/DUF883 family membrane-anchored ribosome-binding protein
MQQPRTRAHLIAGAIRTNCEEYRIEETYLMAIDFMEKSATFDDVVREVSRFKATVTDAVDDGVKSALRAIKQGRNAADDMVHDTRHAVRQSPFQAMGIVFAAGVMAGAVAAWLGTRRG